MSWLVAVCFPGLLMLSTFGLQRLESVMHGDRPAAAEIVAGIEQDARDARQRPPLPVAVPRPVGLSPRGVEPGLRLLADEPGLPTGPNPLFQPTGYANPV